MKTTKGRVKPCLELPKTKQNVKYDPGMMCCSCQAVNKDLDICKAALKQLGVDIGKLLEKTQA
jgi:hypothetical protein